MNAKYRPLYLFLGFAGLIGLIYFVVTTLPDINPGIVLLITIPDILAFYLAYKTYPVESPVKRVR